MDAKKLLDCVLGMRSASGHGARGDSPSPDYPASLLITSAQQRLAAIKAPDGLTALELLARQACDDDAWSVAPVSGAPDDTTALPDEARARVLLRAMIAAAKVDGRLDEAVRSILADGHVPISAEERAFLQEQMDQRPMLDDVARRLTTRAETIEVYAASRLALDPSRPLSRHYLDMLAARLGLERALVERIEETVARQHPVEPAYGCRA